MHHYGFIEMAIHDGNLTTVFYPKLGHFNRKKMNDYFSNTRES